MAEGRSVAGHQHDNLDDRLQSALQRVKDYLDDRARRAPLSGTAPVEVGNRPLQISDVRLLFRVVDNILSRDAKNHHDAALQLLARAEAVAIAEYGGVSATLMQRAAAVHALLSLTEPDVKAPQVVDVVDTL